MIVIKFAAVDIYCHFIIRSFLIQFYFLYTILTRKKSWRDKLKKLFSWLSKSPLGWHNDHPLLHWVSSIHIVDWILQRKFYSLFLTFKTIIIFILSPTRQVHFILMGAIYSDFIFPCVHFQIPNLFCHKLWPYTACNCF